MPSLQVTKYPVVGEAGQLSVPEASISQLAALLVGSSEVRDTALFCPRAFTQNRFPLANRPPFLQRGTAPRLLG